MKPLYNVYRMIIKNKPRRHTEEYYKNISVFSKPVDKVVYKLEDGKIKEITKKEQKKKNFYQKDPR